jgi:hypothetical protein
MKKPNGEKRLSPVARLLGGRLAAVPRQRLSSARPARNDLRDRIRAGIKRLARQWNYHRRAFAGHRTGHILAVRFTGAGEFLKSLRDSSATHNPNLLKSAEPVQIYFTEKARLYPTTGTADSAGNGQPL